MKVMSSENDFAQYNKISERFTTKHVISGIRKIKTSMVQGQRQSTYPQTIRNKLTSCKQY